MEMKQLARELPPVWDNSIAGSGFMFYSTILAQDLFEMKNCKE